MYIHVYKYLPHFLMGQPCVIHTYIRTCTCPFSYGSTLSYTYIYIYLPIFLWVSPILYVPAHFLIGQPDIVQGLRAGGLYTKCFLVVVSGFVILPSAEQHVPLVHQGYRYKTSCVTVYCLYVGTP